MTTPEIIHGHIGGSAPCQRVGPWAVIEYTLGIHDVSVAYNGTILFELPYRNRDVPVWRARRNSNHWPPGAEEIYAFALEMIELNLPVTLMIDFLVAKIRTLPHE